MNLEGICLTCRLDLLQNFASPLELHHLRPLAFSHVQAVPLIMVQAVVGVQVFKKRIDVTQFSCT